MDVDVIVLGTGLTESITAAALSKAGYSVAHVDANPYYGGDEASLNLDELLEWADWHASSSDTPASTYVSAQRAKFTSISRSAATLPPQSRQYAVSLAPTIIPSVGPLIDSLIASGVSRYGGFKLMEKVAIYDGPGSVKAVPGSKEDVFKNKELSLLEKRRLMRFLMFAAGEFEGKKELEGKEQTPFVGFLREAFSLDDRTAGAIAYALAFCSSSSDPTLPALQRTRRYLRSAGRYGPSPFLVGHYGGLGEIAQGFCRTSAVNGATYILGRQISTVERIPGPLDSQTAEVDDIAPSPPETRRRYKVQLEDLPDELSCDLIVSSPDYVPPALLPDSSDSSYLRADQGIGPSYSVARCVAIIDRPISFTFHDQDTEELTLDPSEEETMDGEAQQQVKEELDTALLVFPPGSLPNGSDDVAVNVLVTGEGSMSAPRGKWILYISMPLQDSTSQAAEELLRPYLDAALALTVPQLDGPGPTQPLFTLFYRQHSSAAPSAMPSETPSLVIMTSTGTTLLPELADSATSQAESIFWKAVAVLKASGRRPRRRKTEDGEGESQSEEVEQDVESFWPPLDVIDDPSEDW